MEVKSNTSVQIINNNLGARQRKSFFKLSDNLGLKKDVVEVSAKDNKKNLLNKNLIITAGLAVAGGAIFAATRGKVNIFNSVSKSAEFVNAKSVKEAVRFGKRNLRILSYEKSELANLDMLNTLNEMLHREKSLTGEIPQIVRFLKRGELSITAPMGYKLDPKINKKVLFVNTDTFNRFDEVIKDAFVERGRGTGLSNCINIKDGKYVLSDISLKSENMDKFIEKLNQFGPNSTFKDKMEIYEGISSAKSVLHARKLGLKDCQMQDFAYDDTFIHEMGHMHHKSIYPRYEEAGGQFSQIRMDFTRLEMDPDKRQVLYRVSSYAASSPLEFVAEVYKGLRKGQSFDNEVMALYRTYNGPLCN